MRDFFKNLKVAPENYGLLRRIYFAFFTSGLMSILLGAMLPYIRHENTLSYSQSGLMLSAHQFGNLAAVLIAGGLPYVLGRKKSTLITFAGTAIGLLLMVIVHSPLLLLAAFTLTGIGRGTMSNICNVVISDVSGNKTGALNLLHAIFATGALISPVILYLATLTDDAYWKVAALTAAALSITAWILIARSKLSSKPGKKDSGSSRLFLKDFSFWINTMILFFYLCAEASIVGWFVIYFEDLGILPAIVAKFTPSLLWLMIMIGRLSCAAISSKVNKNKLLLLLSILFALCFGGMLLSKSAVPCVLFIIGIGLSMAGIYPTTLSTMQSSSSTVATGVTIAVASIGAIIMPGIVGAVADTYGLTGGVTTVLTALFLIIVLVIIKYRRA